MEPSLAPQHIYLVFLWIVLAILTLNWMWIFRDLHRSAVFWRSTWLFGIPIAIFIGDNYTFRELYFIPYIAIIAIEEALKVIGLRTSRGNKQAIALLLLFPLWELLFTKSSATLFGGQEFATFIANSEASYLVISIMPVLMHAATAAIYIVAGRNYWSASLAVNFMVHLTFNETRGLYVSYDAVPSVNFSFLVVDLIVFGLFWWIILPLVLKKIRGP
jgi:hypothetical protein